jgi:archaetidylinositol phosphate synthase
MGRATELADDMRGWQAPAPAGKRGMVALRGTSWTHLLARQMVRPLLGTRVRPNHLTTLRLLSGIAACLCFALGTNSGMIWGGVLWLVSALLDRADGELARIGKMMTPGGDLYDFYADNVVNPAFFLAIGFGLRQSWFGAWSVALGVLSGVCLLLCGLLSKWLEQRGPPGARAYAGKWGFDPEDALYLMAPCAWLGWLNPILLGASIATPVFTVVLGVRLFRLRRAQALA